MAAPRELQRATNTLVCLLQGLTGHVVTIELRNEASIVGKVRHVDGFMDADLSNVSYTDVEKRTTHFNELHVQGKNIRFVHVPDELDMLNVIAQQLELSGKSRKLPRVEQFPRSSSRRQSGALARAKNPETLRKERAIRKGIRDARLRKKVAETAAFIASLENTGSGPGGGSDQTDRTDNK